MRPVGDVVNSRRVLQFDSVSCEMAEFVRIDPSSGMHTRDQLLTDVGELPILPDQKVVLVCQDLELLNQVHVEV